MKIPLCGYFREVRKIMARISISRPKVINKFAPSVILIRPQLGENIGAVARAMLNFGWTDLRLVAPRDGWPNDNAVAVASGAGVILDNTKLFLKTESACADLNFVFAATARSRDLTKDVCVPDKAMSDSTNLIGSGQNVGVMFGPERSGLSNADICLANKIISIPVNSDFSSLNLAQSVAVVAYEWFKLASLENPESSIEEVISFASRLEIQHLIESLVEKLHSSNYFWPEERVISLKDNLTNLIGRLPLTSADVKTVHGVLKALTKDKTII